MNFKLDENLGRRGAELLREAGHDVSTVFEEGLLGANDLALIEFCRQEGRCLVTLDLDFGNPLIFRPSEYHGIVVLRLPPKASPDDLHDGIRTLVGGLRTEGVDGRLWIVQRGRIRQYQEQGTED